jgi:hypothetical protein
VLTIEWWVMLHKTGDVAHSMVFSLAVRILYITWFRCYFTCFLDICFTKIFIFLKNIF